jgi:cytochrome c553
VKRTATTIFKQLDDFRAGKRSSGEMSAIATAVSAQNSADVAVYFASQHDGLPAPHGAPLQGGHTFRESDVAVRLVFAGDPARGIPPCTSCHGPSAIKLGAPRLTGQHPAYIERQLGAFKEGARRNDINEQMRTIASELTASEMHSVAELYGVATTTRMAER